MDIYLSKRTRLNGIYYESGYYQGLTALPEQIAIELINGGYATTINNIPHTEIALVYKDQKTERITIYSPDGSIPVVSAKSIAPYFIHIGNSIAAQDNHFEYTAKQGNGIGIWIDALMQGAFEWLPTNVLGSNINSAAPSVNFRNGVYGWSGGRLTGQIENSIPRLCEIIKQVAAGREVFALLTTFENDGGQGITADAYMTSLASVVSQLLATGVRPIVQLPLPSTGYDTATKRATAWEVRKRIAALYVNNAKIIVVDGARDYYDPGSSNYQPKSGMSDGVHPNKLGAVLIAKSIRDTLKEYVEVGYFPVNPITPNPNVTGSSGISSDGGIPTGAIPTDFNARLFGSPGQSMAVSDSLSGKKLTITANTTTADGYGLYSQTTVNVGVGARVRLVCKITIDSQTSLLAPAPGTLRYGGSGNLLQSVAFPASDTSQLGSSLVGETLVFKSNTVAIAEGNTALQMQALGVGRFPAGVSSGNNVTTVEFAAIENIN